MARNYYSLTHVRESHPQMSDVDRISLWYWWQDSIRYRKEYRWHQTITGGVHLQTTFEMQMRVDFADEEKIEVMRQKWAECGRYAYATASMLQDNGVKPQMAMNHEDWFTGPKDIELMADVLGDALAAGGDDAVPDQDVSSELLGAVRDAASE